MRGVSSASAGMTPSSFWRANDPLALDVPAVVESALVLVGPLLGDVVGRMGRAGREVDEERAIGHQRLLLPDPVRRPVREVLGEVVALLGRGRRLDRRRALVQRRLVLVVLAADEAVERLEPAAAGRPRVERPERRRLPHRDLVALAELRGRVAVELERHRERRLGVRAQRAVAGRRRRRLGDAAHAHRVVVAPGEERLAGRRAQGRGVEPVVAQAARREALRRGRRARAAECARGAEPDVVEEDDEDVGGTLGRQQRLDRRERRVGVLRVVRDQPGRGTVGDRQHRAGVAVGRHGSLGERPARVERREAGA